MRWKEQPTEMASALDSVVLPTPGTSSTRIWPWAIKVANACCTARGLAHDDLANVLYNPVAHCGQGSGFLHSRLRYSHIEFIYESCAGRNAKRV